MKNLLEWLKENPISAASALVALLCFVLVGYFLLIAAGSLTSKIVEDNKNDATTLRSLQNGSVTLPAPDPNDPPEEISGLVINENVIDRITDIYGKIAAQQLFIKSETERINKQNHDGSFIVDFQAPEIDAFAAAVRYDRSFRVLMPPRFTELDASPAEINEVKMPSFRVGPAPPAQWIVDVQAQTVEDYLKTLGSESANALTEKQALGLYLQQQSTLMAQLTQWAYGLDFYADLPQAQLIEIDPERYKDTEQTEAGGPAPTPLQPARGGFTIPGLEGNSGGPTTINVGEAERYGPLTIAAWASAEAAPSVEQLWEGQVELWIIRDLMTTIAQVNQIGTTVTLPNAEGEMVEMPQNVVTAPVKRLLDITVVPYYVGLHTRGGMAGQGSSGGGQADVLLTPAATAPETDPDTGEPLAAPSPVSPGNFGGNAELDQSVYPNPAVVALPQAREPLDGNFHFGPTGRRSNNIYDVRHVWMTMHIKADELPNFFETLRKVNFMTVINMRVTDVDEYAALQEGYVYGDADVVEVTLTIETLWFRTWTKQYMPEVVKKRLAVPDEPDVIAETATP
ncbi:MAG: hypothetical protein AAGC44_01295 [Planctomycetota bacterium]